VRPTLAIMMAPPVVAGGAWSEIGRLDDMVGLGLAGASVLIVLAQVRLLPVYRALSFSAGFWSFTFSSAAAASFGLRWLAQAAPPGHRELGQLLVAAVTVLIGAIAVRSVRALRDGTYLPTAPAGVPLSVPPPAPVSADSSADSAVGSSAGVPRPAVRGDDGSGA
jgi:tellurite resistance protein